METKIISSGALLKNALSFYKTHFGTIAAIVIVPFILHLINAFLSPYLNENNPNVGLALILMLVGILASISVFIAIIALLNTVKQNGPPTSQSYGVGFKLFFPFIWVVILMALVQAGGLVLFVIPGLYLGVLLGMSLYMMVAEDRRGLSALVHSWYYVRGYWWAVVGRLLLFMLIAILVMLAAIAIFMVVGLATIGFDLSQINNIPNASALTLAGDVIFNFLYDFILLPIGAIYSYLMYQSLKTLKPVPMPEEEKKIKRKIVTFLIIGLVVPVLLGILFTAGLAQLILFLSK